MSNKKAKYFAISVPIIVAVLGGLGTVTMHLLEHHFPVDSQVATPVESPKYPDIKIDNAIGDVTSESNNSGIDNSSYSKSESSSTAPTSYQPIEYRSAPKQYVDIQPEQESLSVDEGYSIPLSNQPTIIADYYPPTQPPIPTRPESFEQPANNTRVASPTYTDSDNNSFSIGGNVEANSENNYNYGPTQNGDIHCNGPSSACGQGAESNSEYNDSTFNGPVYN